MAIQIGQVRKIEKKGLLLFSEQELAAHYLRIDCNVLQLPYNLSKNYAYNPYVGFFGHYTINSYAYTLEGRNIAFENQLLFEHWRNVEQVEENITSYLETLIDMLENISLRVNIPLLLTYTPADSLNIVLSPYSDLKFTLPDGCIIQVTSSYVPFETRVNTITVPDIPSPPPPPSDSPSSPPGKGSPPTSGVPGSGKPFEITPPYSAPDDGGNTYVPPDLAGNIPDPTSYGSGAWLVTADVQYKYTDGRPYTSIPGGIKQTTIYGKYKGSGWYFDTGYQYGAVVVYFQRTGSSAIERASFSGGTSSNEVTGTAEIISIESI